MKKKMKNVMIGLIVMLVSALMLIACSNPTETEEKYEPIAPIPNLTLGELITQDGGALFQNASRSLRFFADGGFQVFNMGLFMGIQPESGYGSRYIIDGNTIKIYRSTDTDNAAPFYTITYTLDREIFEITAKTNGAGTAPTNANLPLGKYSQGLLPEFRP